MERELSDSFNQPPPEALDMGRSSRGVFNKQSQVNAAGTRNSVSKCSLETSAQVYNPQEVGHELAEFRETDIVHLRKYRN